MIAELAQAAPAVTLPDLYGEIARTGLLGVLFVLCIYALIKRDKDLTEERKARLDDALAMRNLIEASGQAQGASNKLREEQNRLLETVARNQEMLAATAERLVNNAIAHDVDQFQKIVEAIHAGVAEIKGGK